MGADYIERAYAAAEMGVATALVMGNRLAREAAAARLHEMTKTCARFEQHGNIYVWHFPSSSGDLLLTSNLATARQWYIRRRRGDIDGLEIVYPKDDDL